MATPYRVLGITLLPLLRWRISKVTGLENLPQGGMILVANHQSWIDSILLGGALYRSIDKSIRPIAQSSKWRFLGAIPINEYDKSKVIDIAAGYLQVGHPIMIFPEGNSNKNPELRTGKTGAARLALRSGAPVVPIGIQGTSGVKGWQSLLWFLQFWKPCRVTIGQPFTLPVQAPATMTHERLMAATEQIMEQISNISGKPLPDEPKTEPLHFHQPWLRFIVRKILFPLNRRRVEVVGAEHLPAAGPYIVAANHLSYFDAPALTIAVLKASGHWLFYPTKAAVAAAFRNIIGQGGVDALGMLPLDNADRSKVLRYAEQHLKSGGVIGIFPEGTRNKPRLNPEYPRAMLKGKTGAVRLHLATKAMIIPAAIETPKGLSILDTFLNTVAWWKTMRVTFGPPVKLPAVSHEISHELLEAMTSQVMLAIGQLSGQTYPH